MIELKNLERSIETGATVGNTPDRNIVGKKNLFPNRLSGGQRQLVGVARAVIHKPDEPTGNLHSAKARKIMQMFQQLNEQGTTIVEVTHSEANAAYGTRTFELRDGWLTKNEPVQGRAEVHA